jgi:hypothetical protein
MNIIFRPSKRLTAHNVVTQKVITYLLNDESPFVRDAVLPSRWPMSYSPDGKQPASSAQSLSSPPGATQGPSGCDTAIPEAAGIRHGSGHSDMDGCPSSTTSGGPFEPGSTAPDALTGRLPAA